MAGPRLGARVMKMAEMATAATEHAVRTTGLAMAETA